MIKPTIVPVALIRPGHWMYICLVARQVRKITPMANGVIKFDYSDGTFSLQKPGDSLNILSADDAGV